MKNTFIIFLYLSCIVGVATDVIKANRPIRIFEIIMILFFSMLLFNKIKEIIKNQ